MNHLNPTAALRALAQRYRQAEDAGFPDTLLIVVCAAGGLATGGVALLALVPTHAVLVVAYFAVLATTLAVLLTVLAMVTGVESESERVKIAPEDRSGPVRASSRVRIRRPRGSRETPTTVHP
jgi:hypothetical protein